MKGNKWVKSCLALSVAVVSLGMMVDASAYLGNPSRPNTMWVPAHCSHGCLVKGHYVYFRNLGCCPAPIRWTGSHWEPYGVTWVGCTGSWL